MPEEKTIIGVPEDVAEKLKSEEVKEARDILDVTGERSELWINEKEKERQGKGNEAMETRYISSYERKLKEIQSKSVSKSTTASNTDDDDPVKFDANAIRHMEDTEGRIEKLLQLAEIKGPVHAVSVAKEIDAYTLDRTHDRLADELSERL